MLGRRCSIEGQASARPCFVVDPAVCGLLDGDQTRFDRRFRKEVSRMKATEYQRCGLTDRVTLL